MAAIGMLHMVAARITQEDPLPEYSTGFVIGPSVEADITFNYNDNPDQGDNVTQDDDRGCNGYSGTIENNFIAQEILEQLYGMKHRTDEGSVGISVMSDEDPPFVGFGYIKKACNNGTVSYRAFWYYKAKFTMGSYANGRTKPRDGVEWQHDTSSFTGYGVTLPISNDTSLKFFETATFATEAAAKAWLNNGEHAKISSSSSGSGGSGT